MTDVPVTALTPVFLGGTAWLLAGEGVLRVLCLNRSRMVAAEAVTPLALPHGFSARLDGELLAPFIEPLRRLSPVVGLAFSDGKLTLRVPFDAGRSVELVLPAERGECPKLDPTMKVKANAYGVFDETLKMLRKLKGSESVRVKVRASDGALVVEPPRRVFRVDAGEPVEVRVLFGDLKQAFEFFECAGFAPQMLSFSESVLALETEYGGMKLRALVAGQPE